MASNGYVRADCQDCLFYSYGGEYGYECVLYDEAWYADSMRWVSANDCKENPEIRFQHHKKCEHYSSKKELKNQIREKFGIEKVDYNKTLGC